MEDLNNIYKQLKAEYESLVGRERDMVDKIKSVKDLREKIKTKQLSVDALEKELEQLLNG